ncbi:hypothetical protein PCE1_002039 [Barthelona sp. PCE]
MNDVTRRIDGLSNQQTQICQKMNVLNELAVSISSNARKALPGLEKSVDIFRKTYELSEIFEEMDKQFQLQKADITDIFRIIHQIEAIGLPEFDPTRDYKNFSRLDTIILSKLDNLVGVRQKIELRKQVLSPKRNTTEINADWLDNTDSIKNTVQDLMKNEFEDLNDFLNDE